MSFETGAPPPPPPDHIPPVEVIHVQDAPAHQPAAARPGKGYDATTAILPGPPPGTSTYRLRGTETTETAGAD